MVRNIMADQRRIIKAGEPAHQVLMPLLYFDIFSHPLTLEEIYHFCHRSDWDRAILKKTLEHLIDEGCIYQYEGFYLTQDKPEWVEKRKQNNRRADHYLKKAHQMTQLIRRFPFVEGVLLSGSLSKHVMPENGDIDYFIITRPGRLWIARTLLVLFKKIFLLNSHKYFCVNYFIDMDHLEIEEKNRFTATEIATLLPLNNPDLYRAFVAANGWVSEYYPHFRLRPTHELASRRKSLVQRLGEGLLHGKLGDHLDRILMRRTLHYWQHKFKLLDPNRFAIALKSRRYVSKHHPQDFQQRVLRAYMGAISEFENRNHLKLENLDVWQLKEGNV
ncbi:MAG: nucleotidyltransferase domain-containing protein [Bacteroidota bacterium]